MKEYKVDGQQPSLLPEGKKWKLVWSDEFEGTILDRSKWSFRTNYWGYKADQFTDKGVTLDGKGCIVFKPVVEDGMVKSSQLQTGANSFDNIDLFGAIQNRLKVAKETIRGAIRWKYGRSNRSKSQNLCTDTAITRRA